MPGQKNYTVQQVVTILKEVDHALSLGKTVEESAKSNGISLQTYRLWRKKYGRMTESEINQLQELQAENTRLKRILKMWISQTDM